MRWIPSPDPLPRDEPHTRRELLLLAAVLLVHVVLAWILRAPGIAWGEDDAAYIQLGQQLRHFSYREIQDIAAPIHARFPPGYPLIIALLGWPFSDRLDWLLALNIMFSAGAIVLVYLAARRHLGTTLALLLGGLIAVNPTTLFDAGNVMSEAPFKFLIMLGIWALTREEDGPRYSVLAATALIAAAFTRAAGVVTIPALFVYWIMQRQYRRAGVLALVCVLTVGMWLAFTFLAPDAQDRRLYVSDLGLGEQQRSRFAFLWEIVQRLPERIERMSTRAIPSVLSYPAIAGTLLDNVFWLAATVVLGTTGIVVLLRQWPAAALLLLSYGVLLLIWRYALVRFFSPIVPLMFAALLAGADALTRRFAPRRRMAMVATLATLLVVGAAVADDGRLREAAACDRANPVESAGCWDQYYRAYLKAARWVRDSTPADAVFFVNKERAFYLHSGRKTINQDRVLREDSTTVAEFLRARGVHYTVAAQVGLRENEQNYLLARACRAFVLLREFPEQTFVLRLREATDAPDNDSACRALATYQKWRPRRN